MRRARFLRWVEYQLHYHPADFPERVIEVGDRALRMNRGLCDSLYHDLEKIKAKLDLLPEELEALVKLQWIANSRKGQKTVAEREQRQLELTGEKQ